MCEWDRRSVRRRGSRWSNRCQGISDRQAENPQRHSLNEIVDSIRKVAEIVTDIASASAEQASGIEQVGKALTQMDEVTQQNSALVEENAATAKTLEHQANVMNERVAAFRIGSAEMAPPAHELPPAQSAKVEVAAAGSWPLSERLGPAKPQPVAALNRVVNGSNGTEQVSRMRAAVATAINNDPDWKTISDPSPIGPKFIRQ